MPLPIFLSRVTTRDDGGRTANYTIYGSTVQVRVKNGKGEEIVKNAIMGSNGTIYVAHELAGQHEQWVLMPRAMYDQLVPLAAQPAVSVRAAAAPLTSQPASTKKAK